MKPRIPFRIGYQIDNWEKDLVITADRFENNLYCSYLWAGKEQKKFLDFEPSTTELIFHWDRLEVVILDFESQSKQFYNNLNNQLKIRFENFQPVKHYENIKISKFVCQNISYWNCYDKQTSEVKIIYFSRNFKDNILKNNLRMKIQVPYSIDQLEDMLKAFVEEFNNLSLIKKTKTLSTSDEHLLKFRYKQILALKHYINKKGEVDNKFISFNLFFLFKDRNWK